MRLLSHHQLYLSLVFFGILLAGGNGSCLPGAVTSTPTNTLVPTSTPSPTITSTPSPTVTSAPAPTKQNADLPRCKPVSGGRISGRVTHAGKPVPDGVFVYLSLDGGPLQAVRVKDGHYSLPLLAAQCPDGLHRVGFQLRALGYGRYIRPDRSDLRVDLELPEVFIAPGPACALTFGTIRGRVVVGGADAPDGTAVVSSRVGPGTEYWYVSPSRDSIAQTAFTTGGRYTLTSVGVRCDDGQVLFLPTTLSSLGVSIPITPTQEITIQSIVVPARPETSIN